MITVTIEGCEKGGTYLTHDNDLAVISEIKDKYGENACWFENKEKGVFGREYGQVKVRENGKPRTVTSEIYVDILLR